MRYRRIPESVRLIDVNLPMTESEIVDKVEREANGGLLAQEAEILYPRIGQHNREVFKARVFSKAGACVC